MSNLNNTRVVTNKVRLSYANVWEPKSINGGPLKFSLSILIPKSDIETIEAIEKAIDAAIEEGIYKFGGTVPDKSTLKLPMRDGDLERDDEAYRGCYFINANSITPPQIVDKDVNPILDHSQVYSGVYGRVSINFYAFNSGGNRGVACGLGNIQKLENGHPLGVRSSAEEDFCKGEEDFLA